MGNTNRHSRAIFIRCLALFSAVTVSLVLFSTCVQSPIPVAALQADTFTAGPSPTPSPTNTPTVTPTPTGVLTVEKTVEAKLVNDLNKNGEIDPGDTVHYIIGYSNPGTTDLSNVKIIDDYDEAAIANIAGITANGKNDNDPGTITWTIGDLPAGAENTVTYDATFKDAFAPTGPRSVENQVKVISDQTNAVGDSLTLEVMLPNLTISEDSKLVGDVNSNGQAEPGDTIRFTVSVANSVGENGTGVRAVDLVIRADYDEKLLDQQTEIPDKGMKVGSVISWNFQRLDPGDPIAVTYDAVVLSSLPPGKSTGANVVTVSSRGTLTTSYQNDLAIEVMPTPVPTVATSAPSVAPASQSAGPTSQAISPVSQAVLAGIFLLAAVGGLIGFTFVTTRGNGREIPSTLRDGYILTLIMGTVIILGLAGSVERSAIAGLIGTVAGYVLRGAAEAGSSRPRREAPEQESSSEPRKPRRQAKRN